MTDQQTPETDEDDDFPSVHFSLRNTSGESGELRLHQHHLGLNRYILIQAGDDAVEVEASHVDLDGLAQALIFVLGTALQAEQVSDETRAMALEFIAAAVDG